MTAPSVSFCAHVGSRGAVCGQPITQGILNPNRWMHNIRMFNFSASRKPDAHEAIPMTDPADIEAARRKWQGL